MSVNFSDSTKVIEFIFLLKNWVAISPLTAMLLISYVCNSDNLDVFRESSAFTALWQSLIAPALLSKADGIEIDFALLHYPQILTLFFIVSGSQSNVHNLVLDLLIDWSTRWEVVGKQIFWTITSSICLKDILETTEEESLSSTLDIKTSSTELLIKFTQKFPEFLGHVHFWQRLTGILGQKSLKSLGRTQKINVIRTTIKNDLLRFPPISVIPHSDERVVGIIPSDMKVYKSSAQPILIPFIVRDSLRISESILKMEPVLNDAFSVQFLRLLDYIWRLDGLDLSLFIFGVTPLGSGHGIIECIPGARAISEVTFDKQKLADSTWMMRFISSCAGFTMFTYILGVGDRHTDNILLAPDGKIVHVDYAFILGADPKPFMPSVKISPQLMHVMSTGVSVCDAGNIAFFRRLVQDAFLTIRRNAGLLFAFIPGLPILDKLFSSDQLIRYTTERLFLDGSTDELVALNQLMRLLEESIGSIVPAITDRLHTWVQYWRQ